MQDAIYTALFGALSNEHRLGLVSNNLANVNTTGYKQDSVAFKDTFVRFAHDYVTDSKPYLEAKPLWPEPDLMSKVRLADQNINFSQGGMKQTGNPLDLAITGDGFFRIQTPEGERFTRNGSFKMNLEGQMVDANGNPLIGNGGPVQIPPSAQQVAIDVGGNVIADGQQVGRITLAGFEDPQALEKDGRNYFRIQNGFDAQPQQINPGTPQDAPGGEGGVVPSSINQGYLESANVEVVSEMVKMIEIQRHFEACSKIMKNSQELDQKLMMMARRM